MSDKSFPLRLYDKGDYAVLARLSPGYPPLKGRFPRVTHPSATPVLLRAFDLHVLGMPPAFVLSQDQTLKFASSPNPRSSRPQSPDPKRLASQYVTHRSELTSLPNAQNSKTPLNYSAAVRASLPCSTMSKNKNLSDRNVEPRHGRRDAQSRSRSERRARGLAWGMV